MSAQPPPAPPRRAASPPSTPSRPRSPDRPPPARAAAHSGRLVLLEREMETARTARPSPGAASEPRREPRSIAAHADRRERQNHGRQRQRHPRRHEGLEGLGCERRAGCVLVDSMSTPPKSSPGLRRQRVEVAGRPAARDDHREEPEQHANPERHPAPTAGPPRRGPRDRRSPERAAAASARPSANERRSRVRRSARTGRSGVRMTPFPPRQWIPALLHARSAPCALTREGRRRQRLRRQHAREPRHVGETRLAVNQNSGQIQRQQHRRDPAPFVVFDPREQRRQEQRGDRPPMTPQIASAPASGARLPRPAPASRTRTARAIFPIRMKIG